MRESIPIPGETYTSVRATPQLVGREEELERIKKALSDTEHSYIVYVTGQGGIGKTRLVKHILEHPPEDLPLVIASDLIDLYHTRAHSLAGLIDGLLKVVEPLDGFFRRQLEEMGTDRLEALAQAEQEGLAIAEVISRREELTSFFLEVLSQFTEQNRLVLALDTAERLFTERDPAQQALGLAGGRPPILDWLLQELLPNIRNAVVLLAGRPGPGNLVQALEQVTEHSGQRFLPISLHGFSEEEALGYFEAVVQSIEASGDPGEIQEADTIRRWSEEDRRAIFYCLCDDGEPPRVRPILLALAIDYLVVAGIPMPALTRSLDEARTLTPDQREDIRSQLGQAVVQTLHEYRRPADELIRALGWLGKGADAELLADVAGLERIEVEAALDGIRDLSFIKIRPADNRVFLHDEMYSLLQQYGLDRVTDAERRRVFTTLQLYCNRCIDRARIETARVYRPLAELGLQVMEARTEVMEARAHLQDTLVEDLYYRLRWDAAQGFQAYFRYAEESMVSRDEGLDMQLRAELLGFLAERDPSGELEEVDGLRRADVVADAAVRSIKRLIYYHGQHSKVPEFVEKLSTDAKHLIDAGGDLAQAELDVWEALARTYAGEHEWAERLLLRAVESLERLPHSVRWAGVLARAYTYLGYIHRVQGRHYGAIRSYEKALPLWRATRIGMEQANTLNNQAFVLAQIGAFDAAWQMAWDGLELRERLGPRIPVGLSLNTLAHIRIQANDFRGAQTLAERAVQIFSRLGSVRELGLALIALSEAERRIGGWDTTVRRLESVRWVGKAVEHAEEAESIFRRVQEPVRLIEALIQVGCAYRDWARLRRDHPDVLAEGEEEADAHVHTMEELAERGRRALQEAADLGKRHQVLHRQVQALVNLAWLHYYTELYVDALGFDEARKSLEDQVLAQVEQIIPSDYLITEPLEEGQSGLPSLDRESTVVPFLVQSGKLELLRGQITFNRFTQSGNQDIDALREAVEHYTLSLAYDALSSEHVFRDMRRGMGRIYERLKPLNVQEMATVYDTVAEMEQKYGYEPGESQISRLLRERFGPRELLVPVEL